MFRTCGGFQDFTVHVKTLDDFYKQDQIDYNIIEQRQKLLKFLDGQKAQKPDPTTVFFQKSEQDDDETTKYSLYLPAQFNINFKKLGDFDYDTLSVLIEATYLIRINCHQYEYLLDIIQNNCQLIFQNSQIQRLIKEEKMQKYKKESNQKSDRQEEQTTLLTKQVSCHFIYKNYKQKCIEIMFTKQTHFKIQPDIYATPFQWFQLYQELQFCPISFNQTRKSFTRTKNYNITLKFNFPNFAKDELKIIEDQKKIEALKIEQLNKQDLAKKSKIVQNDDLDADDLGTTAVNANPSNSNIQQSDKSIADKTKSEIKKKNQRMYNNQIKRKKKQFIDTQHPISYAITFRNKYYRPVQNWHYLRSFYYSTNQKYQLQKSFYTFFCCRKKLKITKHIDIPIKELLQQNLKEREQHGQSFNQIRIKISIYKKPWVLILFFLLPVCILGILNISVLFQSPQLKDRIASLATIMVAYFASLYQIRQQITYAFRFTLLQQLIYIMVSLPIVTLITSVVYRDTSPAGWDFDWRHSAPFWINTFFLFYIIIGYVIGVTTQLIATSGALKNNPYYKEKPYQKQENRIYDNFFLSSSKFEQEKRKTKAQRKRQEKQRKEKQQREKKQKQEREKIQKQDKKQKKRKEKQEQERKKNQKKQLNPQIKDQQRVDQSGKVMMRT